MSDDKEAAKKAALAILEIMPEELLSDEEVLDTLSRKFAMGSYIAKCRELGMDVREHLEKTGAEGLGQCMAFTFSNENNLSDAITGNIELVFFRDKSVYAQYVSGNEHLEPESATQGNAADNLKKLLVDITKTNLIRDELNGRKSNED